MNPQSTTDTAGAMASIAVLGLGRMGVPMAARLVQAGFDVTGFDPSPAAQERAATSGVKIGDSAADVIARADVILSILPDEHAVEDLMRGSEPAGERVRPGALWLEMTSSHPTTTRKLADLVHRHGADLLDAPVSGGIRGAEEGTLTILAAGTTELVERARPVLSRLGRTIAHVGERPGDGDIAKCLNNMLSAINLTAASEALALAAKSGLRLESFAQAVAGASGGSHAMAVKVEKFALHGRFDAGFTIDQYRKDLRIAISSFQDAGIETSLGRETQRIWDELSIDGHGAEDHTRVVALLAALTAGPSEPQVDATDGHGALVSPSVGGQHD